MKQGKQLGEGTFGMVYVGTDLNSGDEYAVKRNLVEKRTSFIGSIRETDVLKKLLGHPHIVQLEKIAFNAPFIGELFTPIDKDDKERRGQRDDSIHFLFEKADHDLHAFIRRNNVTDDYSLHKKYMVNILLGLEYMHGKKIIHRDLKPSNILILPKATDILGIPNVAKLCDFGLAKPYTYQGNQTPGVVTVWYRAPEIALGYPHYDYKVDVWAMACIFYEMLAGRCFLQDCPDKDDSIISKIMELLPTALSKQERVSLVTSNKWRTVKIFKYADPTTKRKSFLDKLCLTSANKECFAKTAGDLNLFCNLLDKMFVFDWEKRYTVTECLDHAFFDDFRELIQLTRQYYNPKPDTYTMINSIKCIEKTWVNELIVNICTKQPSRWFSYRALFQAVDLFDRYLVAMKKNNINQVQIESESEGLIHSKFDTILRFYVCLYICIKYFTSLGAAVSYEEVVEKEYKTREALVTAEMFEGGFISHGLDYDVYETTIYEIADIYDNVLTCESVHQLLMLRINDQDINNVSPVDLYQKYIMAMST